MHSSYCKIRVFLFFFFFFQAEDGIRDYKVTGVQTCALPICDYFYILSNDHAKNFRLMRTPVARPGRDNWEEVIPHRPDVLLEDFEFFRDYLVLSERKDGLVQLRVRPWSGHNEYYLDFGEPAYLAYVSVNRAFDTPVVRFVYTSLTTPSSTYDYDMGTRQKTLLKRDQILGGFDP